MKYSSMKYIISKIRISSLVGNRIDHVSKDFF